MTPGVDYIGIAVTFCCHNGQGKFLLQRRSHNCPDNQGKWQFGGGKLEFGESVEDAVLREIKEEYGCDGTIDQVLSAQTTIHEIGNHISHWITLPHIVQVNESDAICNEPNKANEIEWFSLHTLPEPLHDGTIRFLKTFGSLLKSYS